MSWPPVGIHADDTGYRQISVAQAQLLYSAIDQDTGKLLCDDDCYHCFHMCKIDHPAGSQGQQNQPIPPPVRFPIPRLARRRSLRRTSAQAAEAETKKRHFLVPRCRNRKRQVRLGAFKQYPRRVAAEAPLNRRTVAEWHACKRQRGHGRHKKEFQDHKLSYLSCPHKKPAKKGSHGPLWLVHLF